MNDERLTSPATDRDARQLTLPFLDGGVSFPSLDPMMRAKTLARMAMLAQAPLGAPLGEDRAVDDGGTGEALGRLEP